MYTTHEKMSTQHKLIPRINNSNTNLIIMHTSLIACLLIFIVKTILKISIYTCRTGTQLSSTFRDSVNKG